MTPTTSEREARELLARECEKDGLKALAPAVLNGAEINYGIPRAVVRAIIAALTREQREGVHGTKDCGIEQSAKAVFVPCDCGCGRQCCAHCGTDLGFVQEKPQQEAPGAVAWYVFADTEHWVTLDRDEADKNRADGCQVRPLIFGDTTAPVDVRALRALAEGWRKEANGWLLQTDPAELLRDCAASLLALLDGQPAGVVIDDAMVRRAVHAYDEWMIEHAPDETDAYHDGMRAALTAALGGGGRG